MAKPKDYPMPLDHDLAAFKAEFARTAPTVRSALYEAKIEELRASFALDTAIGLCDEAPHSGNYISPRFVMVNSRSNVWFEI